MLSVIPALLSLAAFSPIAPQQQSVELKLKLREDETVRYRHILNVTTFTPNDINERVASGQIAFTFGATNNGLTPVSMLMEEYEGLDAGTNNSAEGMRQVKTNFEIDNRGNAGALKSEVPQPNLQPFSNLIERSFGGMMSLGFLGWHMPENKIPTGHQWTKTVTAKKFLEMVFSPAGNAFDPLGDVEATFTFIEVIAVNKKPHARVSIDVKGVVDIDLHFPPNDNTGILTVDYETSLLIDLETGLVTRSKTDGVAEIELEGFQIHVVVSELLYKKTTS